MIPAGPGLPGFLLDEAERGGAAAVGVVLDSLGIMINVIVLWQTVYIQAALDHLAANGYPLDPADIARLSPLGHPTINLDSRYRTTNRPPATGLRPLRIN